MKGFWNAIKSFFTKLKEKFLALLKKIGPAMAKGTAAVGRALTAVARVLLRVLVFALTVVVILAVSLGVVVLVTLTATYKGFQALFMLISTPQYLRDGTAEHNWFIFGQSWKPRFFNTLTLTDTERAYMAYQSKPHSNEEPLFDWQPTFAEAV